MKTILAPITLEDGVPAYTATGCNFLTATTIDDGPECRGVEVSTSFGTAMLNADQAIDLAEYLLQAAQAISGAELSYLLNQARMCIAEHDALKKLWEQK